MFSFDFAIVVIEVVVFAGCWSRNLALKFGQNRVSSSFDIVVVVSIFVLVVDDDAVVVVVVFNPRILPLKVGQNQVRNGRNVFVDPTNLALKFGQNRVRNS